MANQKIPKVPPSEHYCPITLQIMFDPVVAEDNHTYEREAIVEWVQTKKTSPKTNQLLTSNFRENISLKNLIQDDLRIHKKYNELYFPEKTHYENILNFLKTANINGFKLLLERDKRILRKPVEGKLLTQIIFTQDNIKFIRTTIQALKKENLFEIQNITDVNMIIDENNCTLLHAAAENGNVQEVKILLKRKANMNIAKASGHTPLQIASIHGNIEIVKFLIESGADIEGNGNTFTPLQEAAIHNRIDVLKYLLEKGANVNHRNHAGWSPLHEAACRGHVETVKILIENGANTKLKTNADSYLPEDVAKNHGYKELAEKIPLWRREKKTLFAIAGIFKQNNIKITNAGFVPIAANNFHGHTGCVRCLKVLPDGRLVSGSDDHTLKVWDVNTGQCTKTLQGHADLVRCVDVYTTTTDVRVISGSNDHTIRVWDMKTGQCLTTLTGHPKAVLSLTFLPDGRLVSGFDDGTLQVWDINSGKCLKTLPNVHSSYIECFTMLVGGCLASGSNDKTIKVWDVNTWQCLCTLAEHIHGVSCFSVLPTNSRLVSGSYDGTLKVWDNGKCVKTIDGKAAVMSLDLLPNGLAVSGHTNKTIKVWELDSGQCLQTLEGHSDGVRCLSVLQDGRLVTGSHDNTIKIWSVNKQFRLECDANVVEELEQKSGCRMQ